MGIAARVPLEEYLNTSYEPDCDYVDGVLEDRNVGKRKHGETQAAIAAFFFPLKKRLHIRVATELRMRVAKERIRIPDIAIFPDSEDAEVLSNPPLLCIEILPPDDRFGRLQKCIADYLTFGVPEIWIIDPYEREAFVVTEECQSAQQVTELRWKGITLRLSEVLPD